MSDDFGLESNDDYVTVIYNDEYHRFEEVMDTLRMVLECERTPAIGNEKLQRVKNAQKVELHSVEAKMG